MRIAVISDTHNRMPQGLPGLIESADEIWHLGDVCQPDTLSALDALTAPLSVVQGNTDPYFNWPERLVLERGGFRFQLQHLPPRDVDETLTALLFGHMHYPIKESFPGGLALNPGAVTGPRNGSASSIAWLQIESGESWTWEIETL